MFKISEEEKIEDIPKDNITVSCERERTYVIYNNKLLGEVDGMGFIKTSYSNIAAKLGVSLEELEAIIPNSVFMTSNRGPQSIDVDYKDNDEIYIPKGVTNI